MSWITTGLKSCSEPTERVRFLVECLRQIPRDASLWQEVLSSIESNVQASKLDDCTAMLQQCESLESKFALSVLMERAGRFTEAANLLDSFSALPAREIEVLRLQALARNKAEAKEHSAALLPLRMAIRLTDSYRSVTASTRILKMLGEVGSNSCRRSVRVAVIGNATHEVSLPHLRAVGFSYGLDLQVFGGAYNQHAQEILDPNSKLRAFRPEIVILATNTDCLALSEESTDPDRVVFEKVKEVTGLWSTCLKALPCSVIQHNFVIPEVSSFGRLSASLSGGRGRILRKLNLALDEAANATTGVVVLDVEHIASVIGKKQWQDERMWIQAKQYPSAAGILLLARHQVALIRSIVGLGSKCVVLDLDNTLWGGIIGEDGLNGIQLGGTPKGDAYVSFQRYLLGLHQRGIILAVCSKNNEPDALQPFDSHPEMLLKRDHFSAFLANWRPKFENLREIASRLNIGLESLVFVDDNAIERDLVRRELPQVEIPELPEDPSSLAASLHRELLFEAVTLTSEDRHRTEAYKGNSKRQEFQSSSESLQDFLFGLRMQAKLRRFDTLNEPRVVQLINKTNQFNLTTQRMSEAEVRAYAQDPRNYTHFLQLADRFGDNGIVGVLMASPEGQALRIDQWLLSCRVLGRQVEDVMLASVWNYARNRGFRKLVGVFKPTAKNSQVADLYDRFRFTLRLTEDSTGTRYYEAELSQESLPPSFFVVDDETSVMAAAGR